MPLPIGTVLDGKYKIVDVLGEGGMGTVYKAILKDAPQAPPRAIKELLIAPNTSDEERNAAIKRFEKEIEILSALNHPRIAKFYNAFQERSNGNYYFAMEFVDGQSLEKILEKAQKPLSEEQVIKWAMQVCEALSYIHSQNPPVILRDLKPGNIMITTKDDVKLIDFGIARRFDPGKRTNTENLGTISYASPEHLGSITARGYKRSAQSPKMQIQTGPRSDIYSLGATMYHLLTNYEPDPIQTPLQGSILAKNPALRTVMVGNQKVCPIEQVIITAMQYYPEHRFENAEAMRQALQNCLSTSTNNIVAETVRFSLMSSPNATLLKPLNPVGWLTCPKCGTQNRSGAKFCKKDGYPLVQGAMAVPPQSHLQTAPPAPIRPRPMQPVTQAHSWSSSTMNKARGAALPSSSGNPVGWLRCPKCNTLNRAGAKFCKHDGEPLVQGVMAVPPQASLQARLPTSQPTQMRSVPPPPPPRIRARPISTGTAVAPAPAVDHYRLGLQAKADRNYAEAVEQFKQALATGASYEVLYNLGWAYRQYGLSLRESNKNLFIENLKLAAEKLEEATRSKPGAFDAYFQLGMCYRELGIYPRAEATFQKAKSLMPQDAAVYYQLGVIAMEQGYFDQAKTHLTEGLQISPDYPPLLIALGRLYSEKGQYKLAVSKLLQATQQDSTWEAWFELGCAYMKLKDWKSALDALDHALQHVTHVSAVYSAKAQCLLKLNKKAEAKKMMQEALQLDRNNTEAIRLQKQV